MSRMGDVEIEGLDELITAFMKLPDDAMLYLEQASNVAGNVVLQKTKEKVPEKSGLLKSKLKLIKARKSDKKPYALNARVTVSKGAEHITPLELGHKLIRNGRTYGKVEAKPFLRPAADESKSAVAEIMTSAMDGAIREMGGNK